MEPMLMLKENRKDPTEKCCFIISSTALHLKINCNYKLYENIAERL